MDKQTGAEVAQGAWKVAMEKLSAGWVFLALVVAGVTFSLMPDWITPADAQPWKVYSIKGMCGAIGTGAVPLVLFIWARHTSWKRRCLAAEEELSKYREDEIGRHAAKLSRTTVNFAGHKISMATVLIDMVDTAAAGLTTRGLANTVKLLAVPDFDLKKDESPEEEKETRALGWEVLTQLSSVGALDKETRESAAPIYTPSKEGIKIADRIRLMDEVGRRNASAPSA